jgi:hypothetical protein
MAQYGQLGNLKADSMRRRATCRAATPPRAAMLGLRYLMSKRMVYACNGTSNKANQFADYITLRSRRERRRSPAPIGDLGAGILHNFWERSATPAADRAR